MKDAWNNDGIRIEKDQLIEEGKDISSVRSQFEKLQKTGIKDCPEDQAKMDRLLEKTIKLPMVKKYKYTEPSDLEGIKKQRPSGPRQLKIRVSDEKLLNKVTGAWLGRCSGCLLGKPVEGMHSPDVWGYLKELKKYPLKDYFRSDVPKEIIEKYKLKKDNPFINTIKFMPEDDDTNYTVIGMAILKQYGKDFKPTDVAEFWMSNLPIWHTCSAERVAYRNFAQNIEPPLSAIERNPFREWIGAQIRADFFGYAAMGNPQLAAEFAFRDACVSHIKNGIYGEMWAAAMIAAAAVVNDVKEVIEIGLSEIPKKSRLTEAIKEVIKWHKSGIDAEAAIKKIHKKWDEKYAHHWCHTISNAQIVAMGLLWGRKNFERSICLAVQACFDTDCNGATVGSIIGMMLGAKKLPAKWTAPLNDKLQTGISGYHMVKISKLAKEGFKLYKKINK